MDVDRYHRQVLLPQIGPAGQARLAASRVLLVGCGTWVASSRSNSSRAGVGFLRVVDRDVVEWTNLQRQVLFDESDGARESPRRSPPGGGWGGSIRWSPSSRWSPTSTPATSNHWRRPRAEPSISLPTAPTMSKRGLPDQRRRGEVGDPLGVRGVRRHRGPRDAGDAGAYRVPSLRLSESAGWCGFANVRHRWFARAGCWGRGVDAVNRRDSIAERPGGGRSRRVVVGGPVGGADEDDAGGAPGGLPGVRPAANSIFCRGRRGGRQPSAGAGPCRCDRRRATHDWISRPRAKTPRRRAGPADAISHPLPLGKRADAGRPDLVCRRADDRQWHDG